MFRNFFIQTLYFHSDYRHNLLIETRNPSNKRKPKMTKDQINDKIRAAKIAISEAEMEGLRGQAMIDLKAELANLKAQFKAAK
ncbi:hypothetical protein PA3000051 [Pseudomonas phage vB_PaeM_HZ_ZJUPA3]